MTAQLDQIRFEMEEARREARERAVVAQERDRRERRRFVIQTIVTSIAGVTAAIALLLHLTGALK